MQDGADLLLWGHQVGWGRFLGGVHCIEVNMYTRNYTSLRAQLGELPELSLPPCSQLAVSSKVSILPWESPDSEPDSDGITQRVCFLPGALVSTMLGHASVLVHGGGWFTVAAVRCCVNTHSLSHSRRASGQSPVCTVFRPGSRALSRACLGNTCPAISRVCARKWGGQAMELAYI